MAADPDIARALAIGPDSSSAAHTIDITTIGARSGSSRRIEIWFHRVEGHWYISGVPGPRSWYANVVANPRFVLHLKNGVRADLPATATLVDAATRRTVIEAILSLQDRQAGSGRPRQNAADWFARSPLIEVVFDDRELVEAASSLPDAASGA